MEVSLFQYTQAFYWSFALGAVIFGVYLLFGLVRLLAPPGRVRLFFEDVLFMLLAAVLNFLFALSQTNGTIRAFSLAAQIAAFGLLYATVGRLLKRFSGLLRCVLLRACHAAADPAAAWLHRSALKLQEGCRRIFGKRKLPKNEKK